VTNHEADQRRSPKHGAQPALLLDAESRRTPQASGAANRKLSDRAFSLALMESEGRVLEAIARGGPLERLLSNLVLAIERLSSGMRGSVLLLDADGLHLRHGAAPHLPLAYRKAIDGVRIGPAAGSCGTAAYTAKPVVVVDIQEDPRWRPYRRLAAQHALRACWSTPIFSRDRRVLGAFALYYDQVRSPGERDKRLVQIASDLAAIAIERDLADRRLEARAPAAQSWRGTGTHRKLSARELEVFRRIAHGESVKRIARTLDLSISTVYTHRARIFEKLGVRSNVALAHYAVAQGAAY
jgi:DNA-binding NarL/FixJ family response regulator